MSDYTINYRYTLLDRANAMPGGQTLLPIINTLNLLVDDFYKDVPFVPCNRGLSHIMRRANEMTTSQNRRLYKGVSPTKMGTIPVREHIVAKERLRSIDEKVFEGMSEADMATELRNQDEAHIRKLGEDGVSAFFNGGVAEDSSLIRGLSDRLNTISGNSLNNVASCGFNSAVGNSRIYIVEWNPAGSIGCFGIYPNGAGGNSSKLGVRSVNFGKVKTIDTDDTSASYITHDARHYLDVGLAVGDNLKIACVANINTDEDGGSNFTSGNAARKLIKLLANGHFDRSMTRIYCNQDIKAQIDILGGEKTNLWLTTENVFGVPVQTFQKIPIRVLDRVILSSNCPVVV